jgi:hypothetical protein
MAIASSVGDKWEVVIEGRMEGQLTSNVLHFSTVAATSDVETHLIQVLLTCWITHLLPVITSAWELERVRWKQVYPVLGVEQISIPVGTPAGGGAATALPSYCAAVISKRSLSGGRSKRGRMYIAGIPEGMATISALDSSADFWEALVAFCLCIVTEFVHVDPTGTDKFDLMVYSRKLGGSSYPLGIAGFTQVREVVPQQQLGTMRSRKVGRGA